MNSTLSVFPYKAKFLGLGLMVLALPFAYLYFWGGKPDIFNFKTFAFITTYLETRYFVMSQTNILDELAAVLFLSGISLVSFSKEKNEKQEFDILRSKALTNSVFITIVLWMVSFLLFYGMAIFIASFLIFVILLVVYNLLFRYYLLKDKNSTTRS
jgi:hypothetical protein